MKDEGEWMKNDAAANWLRKHETRALRKGDYRSSAQQPACSGMRRPRRKNLKRTHADLDPFDPHDQLASGRYETATMDVTRRTCCAGGLPAPVFIHVRH
jgi:hypothetical protein